MKISDDDIIPMLSGDDSPELETRVNEATKIDQKAAGRHAEWSTILRAIQSKRDTAKSMNERVVKGVMLRLAEQKVSRPQIETGRLHWSAAVPRWKNSYAALVVAACLVISAGYFWLNNTDPRLPSLNTFENETIELGVYHVAFQSSGPGIGTESQPFNTLENAIKVVETGGILMLESGSTDERARIVKPVTLKAIDGGSVQIGMREQ